MNQPNSGVVYNSNIPATTLSISHRNLSGCTDIVHSMRQLGIMTSVTENQSVICNRDKCWLETGCRLVFGGISKQDLQTRIWDSLRDQYGLTCAHLNVQGVYSGCILDYLRESRCPGAIED
jgi:hypothetical protein